VDLKVSYSLERLQQTYFELEGAFLLPKLSFQVVPHSKERSLFEFWLNNVYSRFFPGRFSYRFVYCVVLLSAFNAQTAFTFT